MWRLREKHDCSLATGSISMLPKLHPNAPRYRKYLREMRKLTLVSPINPKTLYVFKSSASITKERRRHIKYYKHTIHPYSVISMVREIGMSIIWFIYFTVHAFQLAFYEKHMSSNLVQYAHLISSFFHSLHIVSIFFTGCHDKKERTIILGLKPIALIYMRTYFAFDLLLLIPTQEVFRNKYFNWLAYILHLAACPRIITMGEYFRHITLFLELGDMIHELLCLIIGGFILIHWWAVLLFGIPKFQQTSKTTEKISWVSNFAEYLE